MTLKNAKSIYMHHTDPAASWWIAWVNAARTTADLTPRRQQRDHL